VDQYRDLTIQEIENKYRNDRREHHKSNIIDSLRTMLQSMGTKKKRILIIFTDGDDNCSRKGAKAIHKEMLETLKENIVTIVFTYGDVYLGPHVFHFHGNEFNHESHHLKELVENMLMHSVDIKTKLEEHGIVFNHRTIKANSLANDMDCEVNELLASSLPDPPSTPLIDIMLEQSL